MYKENKNTKTVIFDIHFKYSIQNVKNLIKYITQKKKQLSTDIFVTILQYGNIKK